MGKRKKTKAEGARKPASVKCGGCGKLARTPLAKPQGAMVKRGDRLEWACSTKCEAKLAG